MKDKTNKKSSTRNKVAFAAVLLVVLATGAGLAVKSHQKTELAAQAKSSKSLAVKTLATENNDRLSGVKAEPVTKNTAAPNGSSQTSQTTSTPAQAPTNGIQSAPQSTNSAPAPTGSVSISSDGCSVSAAGPADAHFKITITKASGGGGGDAIYSLPASGIRKEYSGGFRGQNVKGQLFNANGNQIASALGTITASSCPAGNPSD